MFAGATAPLLGGGESGPSWRAFPFSATENLFVGAMGLERDGQASWKKKEKLARKQR